MSLQIKGIPGQVVNHLFQVFLVTYLILLLVEQIWVGIVSTYLNLNYILIIVIILGILDVFSEKHRPIHRYATKKDYIFVAILGVLGTIIIKYKTASLDWLSWLISIVAGVLIILISILILQDDETN